MKSVSISGILLLLLLFQSCNQNIDKHIKEAVREVNKDCPMMVDSETRLDYSEALPDKTIRYTYTLVNIPLENVDIDIFSSNMEPYIIESLKSDDILTFFRNNDVTFIYVYKDKEDNHISTFRITPDKYK